MANIFDQLEQAAAEGGASEPFNYAMDRLPSMGEAAGGGAYMGANYLAPETVDYGFTGVGNYGPQGGNVGVNYAQGGLSANVSAPVSERTDSVKSLLNNITAGFRYTGKF